MCVCVYIYIYIHTYACMLNLFSHIRLFVSLWIVACQTCQAPLSMGFSRQEYLSGLPCPPLGDLPNPGIKPVSLAVPELQADSLPLSHQGKPYVYTYIIFMFFSIKIYYRILNIVPYAI